MAKLIINPTSSSRREITLARTIVSIGRDPSNDVVLPDAMVSRRHAVIEYRGSQYFLRDCNSSNGSLVNGDRVSERNLRDGDLVAIGTARILFREEMEDAGAKVVPHPSAPRQVCPTCQADYRKGDMFCKQCGTSLAPVAPARAVCTACGTAVLLPARFCNACGQPLKESSPGSGEVGAEPNRSRSASEAPLPVPPAAPDGSGDGAASAASDSGAGEAVAVEPGAAAEEMPDGGGSAPADPASPSEPASSGADVPSPPRLPRALGDSGPVRSSALAEVIRPSAPPDLTTPAAAPARMVGPRPAPAIVRSRGDAGRQPKVVPASASPAEKPAGIGVRAVAGLVDALLVGGAQLLLLSPVLYYWYEFWWSNPPATAGEVAFWPILVSMVLGPVVLALGAVFYVYHWGVKGATPGKRLLGLVVQAEDGSEPIGLARAAIRVLGCVLSGLILGIGFLMIAFGGIALHDRLAGTRVVRRERG
jgi:uncharacterized RDD family membrane protein YckC/predicted component of type VI protein secretion system